MTKTQHILRALEEDEIRWPSIGEVRQYSEVFPFKYCSKPSVFSARALIYYDVINKADELFRGFSKADMVLCGKAYPLTWFLPNLSSYNVEVDYVVGKKQIYASKLTFYDLMLWFDNHSVLTMNTRINMMIRSIAHDDTDNNPIVANLNRFRRHAKKMAFSDPDVRRVE